jgi:hypothetical protein
MKKKHLIIILDMVIAGTLVAVSAQNEESRYVPET